jgi:hypothetical protein
MACQDEGMTHPWRIDAISVVVLGLAAGSLAGVPAAAAAHPGRVGGCAQAKHKFIEAKSATVHGHLVKVKAHPAKFHCGGEDDGHFSVLRRNVTITLRSSAVVTVFKSPEDPSVTKTIKPAALAHWLKKNKSEPIYRIAGAETDVTTMSEQFHP